MREPFVHFGRTWIMRHHEPGTFDAIPPLGHYPRTDMHSSAANRGSAT